MQRCCEASRYYSLRWLRSISRISQSCFWHLRSSLCRLSAFKKACPFEFIRHVRLQADTEFGHLFCRISVSQCEFNKGAFRLSGGGGHATSRMQTNYRVMRPRECELTKRTYAFTPALCSRQRQHQSLHTPVAHRWVQTALPALPSPSPHESIPAWR